MAEKEAVSFEIVEHIATLSTNEKSQWTKELNRVAWSGRDPKYDLRDWSPDHTKMGKGITLTAEELQNLENALRNFL